ncbi:aldo/keto reductase [Tuberibacillus sp. Marseille-P3662]|uniref:aldo/keto reductase n=1 Tax=Tuberibacillus sp. Marseille-P3662 TaxID=1965358 RepID=UPI000A1C9C7B|nr:aldo/keto reductase [Tuberibacillus sp. Marseille-P3662]
MSLSLDSTVKLNNGVEMPWFGLGVYKVEDGKEVHTSVQSALQNGYRAIDTASFYQNEEGVGQAIKASGVPRDDIFVTTKVWNDEQGYESTLEAFENSRKKLGLDVIDLYLIHWPIKGKFKDTWRAMEKLYNDGKVRAIGVSNFKVHHLEELLADATVKPVINQIELHPRLTQEDVREFCQKNEILVEAWSPLMRGKVFDDPVIESLSKKYNKSPAQIILRWDLQSNIVTIPKSVHEERIKQNADIFDFELSQEDIEQIDALNRDERVGPDPDNMS